MVGMLQEKLAEKSFTISQLEGRLKSRGSEVFKLISDQGNLKNSDSGQNGASLEKMEVYQNLAKSKQLEKNNASL